ncbi:hypothetical protein [Sorangium sp. So ce1335]|uniref:hypothetical protein n=1 Tax=Sorangium sp. So ce1335 TaxID=3133335 RepID=UPI003F62D1E9
MDRGLRASHQHRGDKRDRGVLAQPVALLLGLDQPRQHVAVERPSAALLDGVAHDVDPYAQRCIELPHVFGRELTGHRKRVDRVRETPG